MRAHPPIGLICPLFIPLGAEPERVMSRVALNVLPHVDGIAIDPGFFPRGPVPSPEEMARDLSLILAAAPGSPVFVKLTGQSEGEVARCLERYEELLGEPKDDREVFYLDAPLYYRSNRGLPEYYERLLKRTRRSVVLVNDPGLLRVRKGLTRRKNIRTAILKRLVQNEGIAGLVHKGTLARGLNYARAARHRPSFRLYEGDEGQFIESPSTAGLFAPSANLLPEEWAALVEGVLSPRAGARQAALRLYALGARLKELALVVKGSPHDAVAEGLSMLGLIPEPPSLPGPAIRKELARLLGVGPARNE